MLRVIGSLLLVVGLSVGCASEQHMVVGPSMDGEIRAALRAATVGEVTLVEPSRAYWIGRDALRPERASLLEALLEAPQAEFEGRRIGPGHPRGHTTLYNVPDDEIMVFTRPTVFVDMVVESGSVESVVRVIRIPTRSAPSYEVWMREPDGSGDLRGTLLDSTTAIEKAWATLARRAGTEASETFLETAASPYRGLPNGNYLGDIGIDILPLRGRAPVRR